MTTNDDRLAPLRRLFADLAWDEAAASVRLDGETQAYDQTTDETTEDICRELRAAGLDPERMQRRVRELRERVAEERGERDDNHPKESLARAFLGRLQWGEAF